MRIFVTTEERAPSHETLEQGRSRQTEGEYAEEIRDFEKKGRFRFESSDTVRDNGGEILPALKIAPGFGVSAEVDPHLEPPSEHAVY